VTFDKGKSLACQPAYQAADTFDVDGFGLELGLEIGIELELGLGVLHVDLAEIT